MVRIPEYRVADHAVLGFVDVFNPLVMGRDGIDTDCNDFHAPLGEFSFVYPGEIEPAAIAAAGVLLTQLLSMRAIAGRQFRERGTSTAALTPLSALTGVALWLALFESGIDPVVSGLLIGLLTNAHGANSPNERLLRRLRPWTGKLVVPLFALANAGLHVDGELLAAAATSPVTWGIVLAFVVGKPLGMVVAARAASTRSVLSLTPGELRGTAMSAGVAFTVSLLIASRAFDGALLDQAKVGILATALLAPLLAAMALSSVRVAPAMTPCVAR